MKKMDEVYFSFKKALEEAKAYNEGLIPLFVTKIVDGHRTRVLQYSDGKEVNIPKKSESKDTIE